MLYGRERFQCAVTERMCADSGRIYADNSQEMHRQRKWVRCLRELCRCSVRCECALTATETLRGEGMCAKCGGALCRDNVQGMHRPTEVGAMFNRAVSVLNAL